MEWALEVTVEDLRPEEEMDLLQMIQDDLGRSLLEDGNVTLWVSRHRDLDAGTRWTTFYSTPSRFSEEQREIVRNNIEVWAYGHNKIYGGDFLPVEVFEEAKDGQEG